MRRWFYISDASNVDLWRAVIAGAIGLIGGGVIYLVAVLRAMASGWDAARRQNEARDVARAEIQENVRRIIDGAGVQHDGESDKAPESEP
jgi:hypothetical protein